MSGSALVKPSRRKTPMRHLRIRLDPLMGFEKRKEVFRVSRCGLYRKVSEEPTAEATVAFGEEPFHLLSHFGHNSSAASTNTASSWVALQALISAKQSGQGSAGRRCQACFYFSLPGRRQGQASSCSNCRENRKMVPYSYVKGEITPSVRTVDGFFSRHRCRAGHQGVSCPAYP